jgi:hypothetical protein
VQGLKQTLLQTHATCCCCYEQACSIWGHFAHSSRLSCPLQVTAQKFEDPATGEEAITKKLDELNDQIKESFRNLEEDYR